MNNTKTLNSIQKLINDYQLKLEEYEWKQERASDTKKDFTEYDLRREQQVLTNSFLYDLSALKSTLEEN